MSGTALRKDSGINIRSGSTTDIAGREDLLVWRRAHSRCSTDTPYTLSARVCPAPARPDTRSGCSSRRRQWSRTGRRHGVIRHRLSTAARCSAGGVVREVDELVGDRLPRLPGGAHVDDRLRSGRDGILRHCRTGCRSLAADLLTPSCRDDIERMARWGLIDRPRAMPRVHDLHDAAAAVPPGRDGHPVSACPPRQTDRRSYPLRSPRELSHHHQGNDLAC